MMTTFHALCESEGCVRRRASSMGELVANVYDCNTPKNAEYVAFVNGSWVFACETHKPVNGDVLLRTKDVDADPDRWRTPPDAYAAGWSAAFEAIVEPMVRFS